MDIFIIGIIVGIAMGIAIPYVLPFKTSATIVVDDKDADGTYIFLELTVPPEKLMKKHRSMVTIENRGYFKDSQ